MAITVNDLLHPVGEVQPQMFPDGDVIDSCVTWMEEAEDKVGTLSGNRRDNAIKLWVYYRASEAIAARIASTPTEQRSFETRTSWSIKYAEYWKKRAVEYLSEFNRLASRPTVSARTGQSRQLRTVVVW